MKQWIKLNAAEFMPVMFVVLVVVFITNISLFQLVKRACQPPTVRYHMKYHAAQDQPAQAPAPYYTEVRYAGQ